MLFKLLVIAIVIGLLAWARKATPAANKSGVRFVQQVTPRDIEAQNPQATLDKAQQQNDNASQLLVVATYNIQTGKNDQGKRDIDASAKVLSGVDLAGIQEVYAPNLLNIIGLGKQQTQVLADHGGFSWLFNATRRRWLREHRGNAILSKLKVLNWRTEMLPDQSGKSFRNMTIAELEWQGQSFHFINTHLHTKKGRAEQLDVVMREFAKYPRAILVGDFNSTRSMPELAMALNDIEIVDAIQQSGISESLDTSEAERIDWILTKGFKVEGGRAQDKGVSDHPYYEVNLTLKV